MNGTIVGMADLVILCILGAVWVPLLVNLALHGHSWIDIGGIMGVIVLVGMTADAWIAPWGMVAVLVFNVVLFLAAFILQRREQANHNRDGTLPK